LSPSEEILTLYRIGNNDQLEEVDYKGGNIYLEAGNYYLQTKKAEWTFVEG
jgi:hypothetical protein